MSEMIDETLKELAAGIARAHEALKRDLGKLRTGRASTSLLEGIRVDYYGVSTPIAQMATVTVPEARMLMVKAWDKTQSKAIEKAIVEAGLGLNPMSDGEFIRIPMPALTEERRKELVKVARKNGEESKISIRKVRHEAKDMLSTIESDGEASADEVERATKKAEEMVQHATQTVEDIVGKKEKDIMEV